MSLHAPQPDEAGSERLLLERLAADAWPPLEQVEVDGWRLRAAGGVTRRANSALPLSPARPLEAVVDFYGARGLPALVQVSDPGLDRELADLGWRAELPTSVLTGPLLSGGDAAVHDEPDEAWLDCWWTVDGRGGPAELDVARRCLTRIAAPAAYASVRVDGRAVAVGRGVTQEGRLGVFAMAVLPAHRRQGHARDLLAALGSWGQAHGAASAYLQVRQDNAAALALYQSCGMSAAYGYGYRYGPGA